MKILRKRILIVEDNPGTLLLLRHMLLKIDPQISIVETDNAEAAYCKLCEASWDGMPYDLVVADVHLPGANGLLLWDLVMKRFPVEFLFISGISEDRWCERTRELEEAPAFLRKPVTEAQLRHFLFSKHYGDDD